MRFLSTRSADLVTLDQALLQGIAPDGGLFVPESLPSFTTDEFSANADLIDVAIQYLTPFFADTKLESALGDICRETFSFPIPLVSARIGTDFDVLILELFHGPTSAFKDVGARFLAASMTRLVEDDDPRGPVKILVATSGDTGGAVAAAFHQREGFEVIVLFPDGRVSARQQHQLTCWGDNVRAFSVKGAFDDCQRMVKAAFADQDMQATHRLSSANSINIGRLLPQSIYYAHASLTHYWATGESLSFVVPTGNLGNGLAAILARACGLPIGDIVLATNANKAIPDYLATGSLDARESIATLASAMDVGNPSNLERLIELFGPVSRLQQTLSSCSYDDAAIRKTISATYAERGYVCCPHTATGIAALHDTVAAADAENWAVVATAHPAKFESVVEPVIDTRVDIPPSLAELMAKPAVYESLAPSLAALSAAIR